LSSKLIPVASGEVATIVTSLEILAPPAPTGPMKSALKLERWRAPVDRERYRALFRQIGQEWLWRGRLVMADDALAAVLDAGTTEIHVATRRDGVPVGLLELDFAVPGEFEIAYFGLVPGMTGNGHGAWLMAHALRIGWSGGDHEKSRGGDHEKSRGGDHEKSRGGDHDKSRGGEPKRPIARGWVHTCDLDHPSALGFYQREGFRPFERAVEIYPDPRAAGLYPREAAPRVPLL
jgi:GNAT superfamily N-acetyltransferase